MGGSLHALVYSRVAQQPDPLAASPALQQDQSQCCSAASGAGDRVSQRRIENTIPVLGVKSLERSIALCRVVLGFEVEWNTSVVCSPARSQ